MAVIGVRHNFITKTDINLDFLAAPPMILNSNTGPRLFCDSSGFIPGEAFNGIVVARLLLVIFKKE